MSTHDWQKPLAVSRSEITARADAAADAKRAQLPKIGMGDLSPIRIEPPKGYRADRTARFDADDRDPVLDVTPRELVARGVVSIEAANDMIAAERRRRNRT